MFSPDPSAERVKQLLNSMREIGREMPRLGERLIEHRASSDFAVKTKPDGSYVTSGDLLSDRELKILIAKHFPNVPHISEEDGDDAALIPDDCVLSDPIDGTSWYIDGREFAIQFSKQQKGIVEAAMIYFPMSRELLYSVQGVGAFLQEVGGVESSFSRSADLTFDPARIALPADLISKVPGAQHVPFRESMFRLLRGELYGRVAAGHAFAWDLRPWEGLLAAGGGVMTSFDGGPMSFRTAGDKHRPLFAVNKGVLAELLQRISN